MTFAPLIGIRAAHSFFALVRDPRNLDDVLDLSDRIAEAEQIEDKLAELNPALAEAAKDAPEWAPRPPAELRELPDGTLGREYARFMDDHGLTPEALDRAPGDGDIERFRANMRGSHDLWHVATGWTPDLLGELGLQAFYLAQLRVPFPAVILAGGLLHTVWKRREHFYEIVDAIAEGWRQGMEAEALMTVDWNDWMELPVEQVRERLGIAAARRRPAPVIPLIDVPSAA